MPPEHLYYQEINSKDGNYYRRWASVFGPSMSELIDRILKSSKHEEQAFNACKPSTLFELFFDMHKHFFHFISFL